MFKRKSKNQEMDLKAIVDKKKIPILILDPKWHELFPEEAKTPAIRKLEKELTELLKQQGKLVNDMKDMKKLKSKLLNQIVENMEETTDLDVQKKRDKKQETSQKMVLEINEKLENGSDELLDMPNKIRNVNEKLVIECLKYWYSVIGRNTKQIEELGSWINQAREKLKQRILLKQEKEEMNTQIYTYMHNLLGYDAINKFDTKFSDDKAE